MTELFLSAWLLVSHGFEWPLYTPEQGLDNGDKPTRIDELDGVPSEPLRSLPGVREVGFEVDAKAHKKKQREAVRSLLPEIAKCHVAGLKRNSEEPELVVGDLWMIISTSKHGAPHVITMYGTYDYPFRACVYEAIGRASFSRSDAIVHYVVGLDVR